MEDKIDISSVIFWDIVGAILWYGFVAGLYYLGQIYSFFFVLYIGFIVTLFLCNMMLTFTFNMLSAEKKAGVESPSSLKFKEKAGKSCLNILHLQTWNRVLPFITGLPFYIFVLFSMKQTWLFLGLAWGRLNFAYLTSLMEQYALEAQSKKEEERE